jgi:cytochrome c oxidase subunit 3
MTFILIISSVTMVMAVHAGHKGDKQGVIKYLFWTIIGGLAFLGCQAWEWHHLITGEHATLIDGQIQWVGQTTRVNPWGDLAGVNEVANALKNSSQQSLAMLTHEQHHDAALQELMGKPKDQLINMIDIAKLHVRENGPVAFGGYFYGITGFHGFHVFSGVVINIIMLIMTQKDVFQKRGHYLMIEKAGLYWHFVDLVWVFVFLCFYLI